MHPLQLPEPDRLVALSYRYDTPQGSRTAYGSTYPDYAALRAAAPMPIAASGSIGSSTPMMIQGAREARTGSVLFASHDFLELLGVSMASGRFFTASEDRRGAPLVAVLSDRYWRVEFNSDPRVIGRVVHVRDRPVEVVGVAPEGFHGLEVGRSPDLFMPLNAIDQIQSYPGLFGDRPPVNWLDPIGQLPRGVTIAQMEARLNGVHLPGADRRTVVLTSVEAAALSPSSRASVEQFSQLLGATVVMLLTAGSITVGLLLLLRTEARSTELAMCLALGASRLRLAAGVVFEGALLAAAGAALALPVSQMLFAGIRAFELPGGIRVDRLDLSIDARVLAGAAVAAVVCVLLMALVASLFGFRRDLGDALRSQAGATPRLTRRRSRSLLVVAQVAVTLVLVAGAGLFARSVARAMSLNPGVDTSRLIRVPLDLAGYGYDRSRAAVFTETLQSRLEGQPVIASVSIYEAPATVGLIRVDGEDRQLPTYTTEIWIDGRYLTTVGRALSGGRAFTANDRAGSPHVAIVSASLAKLIAPGGTALGRHIETNIFGDVSVDVVGIIPDVMRVPGALQPLRLYMPLAQEPVLPTYAGQGSRSLLIRASGPVPAAVKALAATVGSLDPQMHLRAMNSFDDDILDGMAAQRFGMTVMGALGAVALLLTLLGIYVLAESMAALRRREMGIRAALGATAGHLRIVSLSQTLRLIGGGLAVGGALVWLGAGSIRAFLFEVGPFDPLVTGSVAALIAALAILVSLRPAWTAARVDLANLLRED